MSLFDWHALSKKHHQPEENIFNYFWSQDFFYIQRVVTICANPQESQIIFVTVNQKAFFSIIDESPINSAIGFSPL